MKLWFTADTHFGQQRTLELSRRPFDDVARMDAELVRRWNSVVMDDDVVYHLGDFGDPVRVHDLSGKRIVILPGNYDDENVMKELKRDPRVNFIPTETVLGRNRYQETFERLELPPIWLVHEPAIALYVWGTETPPRFYLYGHIHQLQMVKRNGLNVGVDCHQFTPIDLSVLKFYYDAITKHYDKNVFVPYVADWN